MYFLFSTEAVMKKIFSIIILVVTFACLNAKDIIVTDMRGVNVSVPDNL